MFRAIKNKSRLLCGMAKAPADMSSVKWVFFFGSDFEDEDLKSKPQWRMGPRPIEDSTIGYYTPTEETSSESECEDTCEGACRGRRKFYCKSSYHGERPSNGESATYALDDYQSMLNHEKFDLQKSTVLYLHGYLEDPNIESVNVVVEAYLERLDTNIIVLDWSELADGNYCFDAAVNVKKIAPVLAENLLKLFEQGLKLENFHIVGHSLGGQMAGRVGRHIKRLSKGRVVLKRITALDPAFPLYYLVRFFKPIRKSDALFVDVIHTDAWLYGAPYSTGTADFWPNGGKTLQPGCPKRNYKMLSDNDLSSHRRSWWFWAESVADTFEDKFEAVKAKKWSAFKANDILTAEAPYVTMGLNCPTNITGNYYLQTNGIVPFGRGRAGTQYVDPIEVEGFLYTDNHPDRSALTKQKK